MAATSIMLSGQNRLLVWQAPAGCAVCGGGLIIDPELSAHSKRYRSGPAALNEHEASGNTAALDEDQRKALVQGILGNVFISMRK